MVQGNVTEQVKGEQMDGTPIIDYSNFSTKIRSNSFYNHENNFLQHFVNN